MEKWQDDLNKKSLAVIRRSSQGQKENTSAETQDREMREYAGYHGLDLCDQRVFPIIETGYNRDKRTKYREIIQFAIKNDIRHILFYVSSREARNLSDLEDNERLIREGKIIVHHVAERKVYWRGTSDTDFTSRELMGVVHKGESRANSTRTKATAKTKALNGHWPYRHTPLGYRHSKKVDQNGIPIKGTSTLVVDPDARNVRLVQREFELRAQNHSYQQIRKMTLAEGIVPPQMRKSYSHTSIEKRLKNPLYRGYFYLTGDPARYKGAHDLIIPSSILKAVDGSFSGPRTRVIDPERGIFKGWVRCSHPECQRPLTFDPKEKTLKSGEKVEYLYYRCTNSRKIHSKGQSIQEADLFKQFEPAVDSLAITPEFAKRIADALNETHEKQKAAIRKQMEGARLELDRIRTERAGAVRLYAGGKIKESEFNIVSKDLEKSEDHLMNEIERLNLTISDEGMVSVRKVFELAINAKELYKSMSREDRLEYLKEVCSNPTLDGLTLQYQYLAPSLIFLK